jgi:hypothetical protein
MITPIQNTGTTFKIRSFADEEISKLNVILDSKLSLEDFVKEYKQDIINCCMSLYSTLNDDSRTLPTYKLKELARAEADRIMKIWENIEKFQ